MRGDANDAAFATAVGRLFGCELPRASNTWAAADSAIVCWLAPDEWLVVTQPGAAASLVARLEACLQTHDGAVNDLGAGHTIIRVGGEYGRTMLSKGCTVDLDARKFDVGCCAQSFIAKAPALILARTSGVVDVVVRRSFADYLLAWLRDAANEYGAQCGVEEGGP